MVVSRMPHKMGSLDAGIKYNHEIHEKSYASPLFAPLVITASLTRKTSCPGNANDPES